MPNIPNLTSAQLRRILAIKEQIEALRIQLDSIAGGSGGPTPPTVEAPAPAERKSHITAARKPKPIKVLARVRKIRLAKLKGEKATPEPTEAAKKTDRHRRTAGNSGRETEVRETGRGLVEHLDEIGSQQGQAQLIQYLANLRIRYKDDGSGPGGHHGFRVEIRDPFHPDTMPDWLKLAREQFPDLGETIYSFADRHRDRVLRRHERRANINGLSNFIAVMVATSGVLFVYLRRGVLTQPQVVARLRDYLNTFTGTIPQYMDEETTGFLARMHSNGNGNTEQLKRAFEEHNVSGHLRALLLVAQVVRGSADGCDPSSAGSQLPMLVDQVTAFENRIGLEKATAEQIGRALEDYEMLTKQELALWTKIWSGAGSETGSKSGGFKDTGNGERHDTNTNTQIPQEGSKGQSTGPGQTCGGGPGEEGKGQSGAAAIDLIKQWFILQRD